jgi:uncharacterized protein YcbK (DUF882 family)
MRRPALVATVLFLWSVGGTRSALADDEAAAPAAAPQEEPAEAAPAAPDGADGDDAALRGRKRRHGGKHGRRHGALMSGRVVPDDQLRQEPLPKPSGNLHITAINTGEEAVVNLFNEDGSYDLKALEELSHVLRCRRTDAEKPIDPRLLTLLSHVYDHFGAKPIEIVSGYRNQRKKTSNHYKGTATDIRIEGVSPKKVRAFAETLDTGGMGIGLYPRSGFVHIDVRPAPSYRWIDYSPPGSNDAEKRPPRGWKRKKLQS